MKKLKRDEKAISPVVSTVLLIMIVVILAIIILLWSKGFIKEALLKKVADTEKPVDYFCSEIQLESYVSDDEAGAFGFKNVGNVPIYAFDLKTVLKDSGDSSSEEVRDKNGIVNPGFTKLFEDKNYEDYDEIKVIPILLGKKAKSGGREPFQCPERNAFEIKSK